MSRTTAARSTRSRAPAPLGRLGRLLGFRWIYYFTLPIPYHPLLLPATLLALVGWLGWRVAGMATGATGGDGAWGSALALLAGAGAIGLCLSVPVLAWVVVILGGRLVQAVLVLAAMVLLTASVLSGRDPMWTAAVPALFVLAWAVPAVRGRITRARLRAAAAAFTPVEAQRRAVILGRSVDAAVRDALLDHAGTTAVWVQSRHDGRPSTGHFRITPDLAALVRSMARDVLPEGTTLRQQGDHVALACHAPLPDDAIWVEAEREPLPGGSLRGDLHRVTFEDTYWTRSVVTGTVSVVLPVPIAQCFHWVSLTSPSEWMVGFGHGKPVRVGPGRAALHELFAPGRPVEALGAAALDDVLRPLEDAIAERDAAVARLREAALAGPVDLAAHRQTLELLRRGNARALLGDDAPEFLTAWLKRASQGRQRELPSTVAVLLGTLSDEEITAHADLVVDAFNSRKLALEWTLGPDLDPTPLPRDLYRFGDKAGFGLIFRHPDLYVRLGELLPEFRELVAALGREMTLPEVVREAAAARSVPRST